MSIGPILPGSIPAAEPSPEAGRVAPAEDSTGAGFGIALLMAIGAAPMPVAQTQVVPGGLQPMAVPGNAQAPGAPREAAVAASLPAAPASTPGAGTTGSAPTPPTGAVAPAGVRVPLQEFLASEPADRGARDARGGMLLPAAEPEAAVAPAPRAGNEVSHVPGSAPASRAADRTPLESLEGITRIEVRASTAGEAGMLRPRVPVTAEPAPPAATPAPSLAADPVAAQSAGMRRFDPAEVAAPAPARAPSLAAPPPAQAPVLNAPLPPEAGRPARPARTAPHAPAVPASPQRTQEPTRDAPAAPADPESRAPVSRGSRRRDAAESQAAAPSARPAPAETESRAAAWTAAQPPAAGRDAVAKPVESAAPAPLDPTAAPEPPKPTGHATIRFEGEQGLEGRMRVSLRGENVRATIFTPDAATASRMEGDIAALQQSLRDRGFATAHVSVRAGGDAAAAGAADPRGHAQNQDHDPDRSRARDERPRAQQQSRDPGDPRGSRRSHRERA